MPPYRERSSRKFDPDNLESKDDDHKIEPNTGPNVEKPYQRNLTREDRFSLKMSKAVDEFVRADEPSILDGSVNPTEMSPGLEGTPKKQLDFDIQDKE